MKYELLIACADEPEASRKDEGDILAIRPYPHNWGRKEIDQGFVVIVESDRTFEDIVWLSKDVLHRHKKTGDVLDMYDFHHITTTKDEDPNDYELIKKRRYSLQMSEVSKYTAGIDFVKVRDKKKIYQPFKKASQLVQKFDGKNGKRRLAKRDVDTSSRHTQDEEEIVINTITNIVNIFDKKRKGNKRL